MFVGVGASRVRDLFDQAKKAVYGHCDIDMLAGPSEILIVADKTADPAYTAADMLSQAEHDMLASSIVITDSAELAGKVAEEAEKQQRMPLLSMSLFPWMIFLLSMNRLSLKKHLLSTKLLL